MTRRKRYIEANVLDAALDRIRHIYDTHDTVAVCFSGGKDSLVALHLTRTVAEERGELPVRVVFRDEELIPNNVIDFVDSYRAQPWVRMFWFTIPLKSDKFILGSSTAYVQWDPAREHVRPMPAWGIKLDAGDARVFDQYDADRFICERAGFKGKVAFITGIRASESIMRFQASVQKLNDNYINATGYSRLSLCKPLYDWEENDIFKFFGENGITYCPVYDSQLYAGADLRVSTPLHAEQAKKLGMFRRVDPEFYDRVLRVFPEMAVQERYYAELDRKTVLAKYSESMDGVRQWIIDNVTDPSRLQKAFERYELARISRRNDPGAYPIPHILKYFMAGAFKRRILPLKAKGPKRV